MVQIVVAQRRDGTKMFRPDMRKLGIDKVLTADRAAWRAAIIRWKNKFDRKFLN